MVNKKDSLGDRMKSYYEERSRTFLPRRTNTIIRLDGKAFHTYTRGMERPFDMDFIADMNEVSKFLCENIQGVKCAYVQSDEISLFLTDYDNLQTDAWYGGNVQKILSVSASLATAKFNQLRFSRIPSPVNLAFFDSRAFTIPSITEVNNYFVWRQQDCVRNSIQSVGQYHFSHKELNKKNTDMIQDMLHEQRGINWNDYDSHLKRGRFIIKHEVASLHNQVIRRKWGLVEETPNFSSDSDVIIKLSY